MNDPEKYATAVGTRYDWKDSACRLIYTMEAVERARGGNPGFFSLADDIKLLERKTIDVGRGNA